MSSSSSLTLFFFFIFASTFLNTHSFNITHILNLNHEFSTFNKLLSQTQLSSAINTRKPVTVLALSNQAMTSFSDRSISDIKNTLSLHIVLGYYDVKKLRNLNTNSVLLTTLFQSSGQAKGQQGYVNATLMKNGDVLFGSAVRGSILDAKLIDSVTAQPYDISVLHISSSIPIMMDSPSDTPYVSNTPLPPQAPGDDDYNYDEPPSPPSKAKPVVAAATAATAKPPSAKGNSTSGVSAAISAPNFAFAFLISSFWFFMTVW